jgi:NAD(P)-dependent dehydrogenase (short-subunit alcohol dehydrogenase family)
MVADSLNRPPRFVSWRCHDFSGGGIMPNNKWTTADIPDLSGKVIIVTGANAGLGFEASKELARKGARVIMACRNMEKAQAALAQIRAEIPGAPAEVMQLDLASLKSIRQFADKFKAKYDRLDVLLNNAGIMFGPYVKTEDGFESTFGVDHPTGKTCERIVYL